MFMFKFHGAALAAAWIRCVTCGRSRRARVTGVRARARARFVYHRCVAHAAAPLHIHCNHHLHCGARRCILVHSFDSTFCLCRTGFWL